MPELPEVETVRLSLRPFLLGRVLTKVEVGPFPLRLPLDPLSLSLLQGQRLLELSRRGKFLLFSFSQGVLLCHLGMSGRLLLRRGSDSWPAHVHAVFAFDSGWSMLYQDPRRFGLLLALSPQELRSHPLLACLGPEPLAAEEVRAALGAARGKGSRRIRDVLLDQKVLAGLGNIYACEALFVAGIKPSRPISRLSSAHLARLAEAIPQVLSRALAAGGTTLRDGGYVSGLGERGFFAQELAVYGREGQPCPRCGQLVRRRVFSGRAAYFCPRCQR
jgi:formamidopyrimidine-DNA glycosylase